MRSSLPIGYAFHQIPTAPISRRNAWIRATGRKLEKKWGELTFTENTKVCGFHFASGRKSNDPTNVDYIPTYPYLRRLTLTSESAENYSRPVKKHLLIKENNTQIGKGFISNRFE